MYLNIAIYFPTIITVFSHGTLVKYFVCLVLINHNNGIKVSMYVHHISLGAVTYRDSLFVYSVTKQGLTKIG
jgi:hypothetical protein